jgi:hypothetical protein
MLSKVSGSLSSSSDGACGMGGLFMGEGFSYMSFIILESLS